MPGPQVANGEDSQSLDYGNDELTHSKESQIADKKGDGQHGYMALWVGENCVTISRQSPSAVEWG